jgi:hypothetical protein
MFPDTSKLGAACELPPSAALGGGDGDGGTRWLAQQSTATMAAHVVAILQVITFSVMLLVVSVTLSRTRRQVRRRVAAPPDRGAWR